MTRYYVEGVVPPNSLGFVYGVDQLGTVRDQIPVQGSGAAAFDYDPFGNLTAQSGTPASEMSYAGMFYHASSGLYLANYRAYDPQAARWVSKDPIREIAGGNLYTYVGGNPLSMTDPMGLMGGGGNHAPSVPAPPVNDPCVENYIHDNYGDFGGFIATIGNLQQFSPSANPDWWATGKEGVAIGIEKTAASKVVKFVGNAMMRAVPGNLAIGHVVGSGLATFGGTASGVVEVAGAVLTPFGTAAMAMARSACTCQK